MVTYTVKNDEDYKPMILKNGLVMQYDHVLMNGGHFVKNEGTWGNPKHAGSNRITCDDMQRFCTHNSKTCRITEFGKKVTTIIMKDSEKFEGTTTFLCAYHSFEHALLERFTQQGYRVLNNQWENAHP